MWASSSKQFLKSHWALLYNPLFLKLLLICIRVHLTRPTTHFDTWYDWENFFSLLILSLFNYVDKYNSTPVSIFHCDFSIISMWMFFQRWPLANSQDFVRMSQKILGVGEFVGVETQFVNMWWKTTKTKTKITSSKGTCEEGEIWTQSHCKLSAMLEMTGIGPLLPFGRWHLIWAHFPGNPLRMNIEILNIFARIIKFLLKISLFSFSLIPAAAAGFQKVQLVRGISF